MAETPSNMLPLGTVAPDFKLQDVRNNQVVSLKDIKSDVATVIMFICNHCPYVLHIHPTLIEVIKKYQQQNISFVAICSNDADAYPADAPDKMRAQALRYDYSFPYLHDETQKVASAYQAACTPDFYVFDKNLHCVYRGRFDDATPGNHHPSTGKDLSQALDNIIANLPVNPDQKASLGCNIKWKK